MINLKAISHSVLQTGIFQENNRKIETMSRILLTPSISYGKQDLSMTTSSASDFYSHQ